MKISKWRILIGQIYDEMKKSRQSNKKVMNPNESLSYEFKLSRALNDNFPEC